MVTVVFISERSEIEHIGNDHAGTALQNGRGPDHMSGGNAELRADEERAMLISGPVRELVIGFKSVQCAPESSRVHQQVRGSLGEVKREF